MAFCKHCGTQLDENAKFCPSCGKETAEKPVYEGVIMEKNNDVESNKVMAVLAYIGILFLVPLIAAKDSPFAKYHTNQGLLNFLLSIAISIVSAIVPFLGILGIATLAFAIIGIINAVKGEMKPLPLIGQFTLLK